MEKQTYLQNIEQQLPEGVIKTEMIKHNRYVIDIKPGALINMAGQLYDRLGYRFIIASAYHTREGIEIMYHFSDDAAGSIINLHVILPEDKPEIESLTVMFSGANWIEREMREILGITFNNHPEPDKLISDGNWAEGVYPYRKNFKS